MIHVDTELDADMRDYELAGLAALMYVRNTGHDCFDDARNDAWLFLRERRDYFERKRIENGADPDSKHDRCYRVRAAYLDMVCRSDYYRSSIRKRHPRHWGNIPVEEVVDENAGNEMERIEIAFARALDSFPEYREYLDRAFRSPAKQNALWKEYGISRHYGERLSTRFRQAFRDEYLRAGGDPDNLGRKNGARMRRIPNERDFILDEPLEYENLWRTYEHDRSV